MPNDGRTLDSSDVAHVPQPEAAASQHRDLTERAHAMDAQKSERLYRAVADASPVPMALNDEQLNITFLNPAFVETFGYTVDDIPTLAHWWPAAYPDPEYRQWVADTWDVRLAQAKRSGQTFEPLELTVTCKDATTKTVLASATSIVGAFEGEHLVVLNDITAAKQAEEAMRDLSWRMDSVIKGSHFGTWEWNVQTGETLFNERWAEIVGYTLEELAPISIKTWEALAHPDDLRRSEKLLERHFSGELPYYDFENRMRHKDGHWIWVVDRGRIMTRTEDGEPLMMFGTHTDVTRRKEAEEALKESEERFRLAFDASPDAIAISRLSNGALVSVNRGFLQMSGYTEQEAVGRTASEINSWKDPEDREKFVEELQSKGEVRDYEAPLLTKRGEIHGSMSASIITLGGEPHVLVSTRDITARKQAETYAELSREILRILSETEDARDSLACVVAAIRATTGLDAVAIRLQDGEDFPYFAQEGFSESFLSTENTLIERDAGEARRDASGRVKLECTCGLVISGSTDQSSPILTPGGSFWINDSFHLIELSPDEAPRHRPRNRCMHDGYASIALVPIRAKDKTVGLIHLNDRRKGRFTLETVEHLEAMAAQIGSALIRRQAEAALRESAQRHETILRTAMDGFWLVDAEGRLLEVNEAYCEESGYSEQELLTMNIADLVNPDTIEDIAPRIQRVAAEGGLRFEAQPRRKDGSFFDAEVSVQYQSSGGGRIAAFIHDVTERKQAEAALKQMNESLEERIAERTRELNETVEQLTDANEAKTRFLRSMSHELRTPLNSVIGFSFILMDGMAGPINEEQRKQLAMISDSGKHLLALINDILDLSRIEAGVVVVHPEPIDVPELLEELLESVRPAATDSGLELTLEACDPAPLLISDRTKVHQIMLNLLGNAIKFTETGSVTLRAYQPSPSLVALSVSDTGSGIPIEERQHIFGEFERGASLAPGVEGTGLGLAISRGLAGSLGGSLELASEVGKGSTFTLTLPAKPAATS